MQEQGKSRLKSVFIVIGAIFALFAGLASFSTFTGVTLSDYLPLKPKMDQTIEVAVAPVASVPTPMIASTLLPAAKTVSLNTAPLIKSVQRLNLLRDPDYGAEVHFIALPERLNPTAQNLFDDNLATSLTLNATEIVKFGMDVRFAKPAAVNSLSVYVDPIIDRSQRLKTIELCGLISESLACERLVVTVGEVTGRNRISLSFTQPLIGLSINPLNSWSQYGGNVTIGDIEIFDDQ